MDLITAIRADYELDGKPGHLLISDGPHRDPGLGNFEPRLRLGSDPEINIQVAMPQHRQESTTSFSSLEFINVDGRFDFMRRADFVDRPVSVAILPPNAAWNDQVYGWDAIIDQVVFVGQSAVRLNLRSRMALLDQPVVTEFFDDTVPEESLRERAKAVIYGLPLQVPTALVDEISAAEGEYFVAANQFGLAAVEEGGIAIAEGADPGQHQPLPQGFTLNKSPTLPLTANPVGPPRSFWPIKELRFAVWDQLGGFDVPAGWTYENNAPSGDRWIRRFGDEARAEIAVTTGFPWANGVSMSRFGLTPGESYRLRLDMSAHPDSSNVSIGVLVITRDVILSTETVHASGERLFSDPLDMAFSPNAGETQLEILFYCVVEDSAQALLEAMVFQHLSADACARHIDDVVPLLVLDLPEQPIGPADVDWDSLKQLRAAAPALTLADYITEDATVASALTKACRSVFGAWWFDSKLRFGRLTPPESDGEDDEPPVLAITDANRTGDIQIERDDPERFIRTLHLGENFFPIPKDRSAASLSDAVKSRLAREFRQAYSQRQPNVDLLAPFYRSRITVDPEPTALAFQLPTLARHGWLNPLYRLYEKDRFWWRVSVLLLPGQISALKDVRPFGLVNLSSADNRFDASVPIPLRIVGLRVMPARRQVDLTLWG